MSRIYLARVEQLFPYPRFTDGYYAGYACKIGLVKRDGLDRLKKRMGNLQVNNPWQISLDAYSEPMSLQDAEFVEEYYKHKFWRENTRGEWFVIMPDRLDKLKKEIKMAHTLKERRAATRRVLKGVFEHE